VCPDATAHNIEAKAIDIILKAVIAPLIGIVEVEVRVSNGI
jgi:hypothetical protein